MKSNFVMPLIIITLAVVAGAYWYYSSQTGNQPPLAASIVESEAQMQFKTLVGELRNISFDTSIFSNTNFLALANLATQVAPEPSGRLDPFAPLAGASAKDER